MSLASPSSDPVREGLRERLAARPWRLLRWAPAPGAWNMALDAALLELAAREELPPTLRFYAWNPPAVSLGRFQQPEGIDLAYARARGWEVIRRPTGGRAVLHHLELTYSLILPPSLVGRAGVRTSYAVLTEALNCGLRIADCGLGDGVSSHPGLIPQSAIRNPQSSNCFALACECDTVVAGGKLVGSAQARKEGALLQHGSILLDAEPEAWTALFGTPGRLVTLRQLLGEAPDPERVAEAITSAFRSVLDVDLVPGGLTEEEEETARAGLDSYHVE